MRSTRAPRVLVTDAVPMNGGDELLLRSLLGALQRHWPGCTCTVMTHDVEAGRRLLTDTVVVGDLGVEPRGARDQYAAADLVISTPGGFLNQHYDIAPRLDGFRLAAAVGTPLVLYAQSIGPFRDATQERAVGAALADARLIGIRDAVSRERLTRCGIAGPHVVDIPDAAFLWPAPRVASLGQVDASRRARRVALCLRRWPRRDDVLFRETVRKARRLVATLAARGVEEFVWVSTCQGIPGYVDDADLSRRVHAGLSPALAVRTTVVGDRLAPEAFMDLVGGCDLFIGMRLHGCLMAMLAGTPAMGLAYEDKTPQIFDQLGLGGWQLPFTRPAERWCGRAQAMLDALPTLRAQLPHLMAHQRRLAHAAAKRTLDACLPAGAAVAQA